MRELLIETQHASDQIGQDRRFDYYITVDEMEISPDIFCESYGAKVVEPGVDRASAHNLTISTQRIDALMELLMKNQVGPGGFSDVIADWL